MMLKIFRVIAFIEGVSYLILLIGSVLKKTGHDDFGIVKTFGMAHGFLWIGYLLLAFLLKEEKKWTGKDLGIISLMSLIPFGTFYVDFKYLKETK